MWRDLRRYIAALWKHLDGLIAGGVVTLLFWFWQYALKKGDIPTAYWIIAGVIGLFISGFQAWREEHKKVAPAAIDPEVELRRRAFEKAIAKLNPLQLVALYLVVQHGDRDGPALRQSLGEHGYDYDVDVSSADLLLTSIAETGLIELKEKGNAFGRYGIKPAFETLLIEWAARPTAVDIRIADKAEHLKRQLLASFEDWPAGPNKLDDLTTWAAKLLRGFGATDAVLKEIIDLRAEASPRIARTTVEVVRDDYYAFADIINRLFKGGGLSITAENREAVERQVRQALRHVRECLTALSALITLTGN